MSDIKRVKLQNIVESQIPEFLNEDSPLFKEFLEQYYISQEHNTGISDLAVNLPKYKATDIFNNETFYPDTNPCNLLGDVSIFDDVINVNHTIGFPDKWGLLRINGEIITYTDKTSNSFLGCIRGFSGITNVDNGLVSSELTFTSTSSTNHQNGSRVENLNLIFYRKLFTKFKSQFLSGFENRDFVPEIDLQNILFRAKDFYTSKGTNTSYKILFRILYNQEITINNPQDYMMRPSDNKYFVTKNILLEKILGDGDPLDLFGKTLFQQQENGDIVSGAIYNIEYRPINSREKELYEVSLDKETFTSEFISTKKTKILENIKVTDTSILVDSTIGFPSSGEIIILSSNLQEPLVVSYEEKTSNEFLGVSGLITPLNYGDEIIEGNLVYADLDNGNRLEFRVLNIISEIDTSNTAGILVNDKVFLSTFGIDLNTKPEFNNWIYNIPTSHDIQNVRFLGSNSWLITMYDSVKFTIGETIELLSPDDNNDVVVTATVNSFTGINRIEVITSQNISNKTRIQKLVTRSNTSYSNIANRIISNVQNTYIDNSLDNMYVAASGMPDYRITADDRRIFVNTLNTVGISKTDILNTNIRHRYYTGEIIYYFPSQNSGIRTGAYFVTCVGNIEDSQQIKLSFSNSDLFSKKYIDVNVGITSDYIVKIDYENKNLEPQKLLKKIDITKKFKRITGESERTTNNKPVGILVNGVEIYSPTLYDENIYYGKLDEVVITNNGKNYDVINFSGLEILDPVGTGEGAKVTANVVGNLKSVKVLSPGVGYFRKPNVSISGGNGKNAVLDVNLVKTNIASGFNGDGRGVNPTTDIITFINNHNFDDGEEVIYNNNSNASVTPLVNNSTYFVGIVSDTQLKLYNDKKSALTKTNPINLVGVSSGFHQLKTLNTKNAITEVYVVNPGEGYSNKSVTVNSVSSTDQKTNGINLFDNYIFAKNHNFKSEDLIVYSTTESPISGLSTNIQYYIKVLDANRFRLYEAGPKNSISQENYNRDRYVKLNSIGIGTHKFSYPPIEIDVETIPGISAVSIIPPKLEPVVLGSIESVFLESGGVGYGVSDIINFKRRPIINVKKASSEALIRPIVLNGSIVDVQILNFGRGYSKDIDIIVTGSGRFAVLEPILENGRITNINILNGGIGYKQENTEIFVQKRGIDAKFLGEITEWKINQIEKNKLLLQNLDEGILVPSKNQKNGLQFVNFYPPKVLRKKVNDHIDEQNREKLNEIPSPILGWAYDGNPIYGPYFSLESKVRRIRSSYKKSIETDSRIRPTGQGYPEGFFTQDYVYDPSEGDLDKFNGRFIVNNDFPQGTYAYFLTIDGESNSTPTYPYVVSDKFRDTIIAENYNPRFDQEVDFNNLNLLRNTGPYYINSKTSFYPLIDKIDERYKQDFVVTNTINSGISSVLVYSPGENYKVGELVEFDNKGTGGSDISASISEIQGKTISKIKVGITSYTDVILSRNGNFIVGINDVPHNLVTGQNVLFSSISDKRLTFINGFKKIVVNEKESTLTQDIDDIEITGPIITIGVNDVEGFDVDDFIEINSEIFKVLNVDQKLLNLNVLRLENPGIHTSFLSTVKLLPRKFEYTDLNKQINLTNNKTVYFNPSVTLGLGTEGSSYSTSDGGQIFVPPRSIYIPNHPYVTGQPLDYQVGIGTGIIVSNTGAGSTFTLNSGTVYAVKLGKDFVGISTLGFTTSSGIGTDLNSLFFISGTDVGIAHSFKTLFNEVKVKVEDYFCNVETSEPHGLSDNDIINLNLLPNYPEVIYFRYDPILRKITTELIEFDSTMSVDVDTSEIYIPKNKLKLGDKIVYYANEPGSSEIGGLENNQTYYVIPTVPDRFQLAEYYSDAINGNNIKLTSMGVGVNKIALINPPITIINGTTVEFDLSDSSLDDLTLKLYKDDNFIVELDEFSYLGNDGYKLKTSTIKYPSEIYYNFVPSSPIDSRKNEISPDTDVYSRNQIKLVPTKYSREFAVTTVGVSSFILNFDAKPEEFEYEMNSGISTITYTTKSRTASGPISKIKVNFGGKGYKKLPKVSRILTQTGRNAVLKPISGTIGKIDNLDRVKDGFDYPTDTTIRPVLSTPAIVQISGISRINKIEILNGGRGYSTPPRLKVLGNDKIRLSAKIQGGSVSEIEVIENVSNLSSPLEIVPTRNSNGYDIDDIVVNGNQITLELINSDSQLFPLITVGYGRTETVFPFEVGDKIFIENCRILQNSTDNSGNIIRKSNFNSSNFGYTFFTVTNVDKNNYTVTYTVDNSQISFGEYTTDFGYGTVINSKDMASFRMELVDDLKYFSGERVFGYDSLNNNTFSAEVMENGWDNDINQLRLINVSGELQRGYRLKGEVSLLDGFVEDVSIFNIRSTVGTSRDKINDFGDNIGFLNDSQQRISDNFYYQKFSYAIKSTISYDKWKEPVRTLVHPSGFKEFSDLDVISKSTNKLKLGISNDSSTLDLLVNIDNFASMYSRSGFAFVTEDDRLEDGSIQRIIFDEGVTLKSYTLSKTNKVLLIDDISPQFTGITTFLGGGVVGLTSFKLKNRGIPLFSRDFNSASNSVVDLSQNIFTIPNHNFQSGQKLIYKPSEVTIGALAQSEVQEDFSYPELLSTFDSLAYSFDSTQTFDSN
jgi:hypothetical protein